MNRQPSTKHQLPLAARYLWPRNWLSLIAATVLLLSSILTLTACNGEDTRKQVDLSILLPNSWAVDQVLRLDTDGDGENEWVVLYTFDEPDSSAFVPIRGAIYDVASREPKLPIIYPYHLQAPGWNYLGEGQGRVKVKVEDLVTVSRSDTDTPLEVIVESSGGGSRLVNRVSIYRWQDNIASQLRKRTDPHEVLIVPGQPRASGEWYECIGMFESTSQVKVGLDEVRVIDRIWEDRVAADRSQLGRVRVYRPDARLGGYLDENQQLVQPIATCIDFAYGMPEDLSDSPYPEKIVMAFHNTFPEDPEQSATFLSPGAIERRKRDPVWRLYDSPGAKACVQLVSYGPPDETNAEITSYGIADAQRVTDLQAQTQPEIQTQATQQAAPQSLPIMAYVETWAVHETPGQQAETVKVLWTLMREEVQEGKEGQWKIDDVRRVN